MFRLTGVLLVLVLYQIVVQAKVDPSVTTLVEEESSSSKRTLFSIVWGCVSTTIICAWTAVHPNIAPREGPIKRTFRRLELMFWTIVAPEILPCWAMNQLLAAITARDVYNVGKGYATKRSGIWETMKVWFSWHEIKGEAGPAWTVAHGHFIIMGGFHVVEPAEVQDVLMEANTDMQPATLVKETNMDTEKAHHGPSEKKPGGRVTIMTLEILRELVKDPDFEMQISAEEINDRSKGDTLSKLIFILQSTWFILQCLGRRIQGLDLTHIELTTLALASLNGITFALWWDKPLGAQAIVRVYLKRKLTDLERQPFPEVRDHSARSYAALAVQKIFKFQNCAAVVRDAFLCQPTGNIFVVWLLFVPIAILLLLLFPIVAFIFAFSATVTDLIGGTSSSFPPDHTHVPTFYVPKHRYPEWFHILLLVVLASIFGGIHCSGWDFSFPTYVEQCIWRGTSLAVTIIPIAIIPIAIFPFVLFTLSVAEYFFPILEPLTKNFGGWTLVVCALVYVSARLILLGLAFALLGHLPPTAFIAINWTKFYPHFL